MVCTGLAFGSTAPEKTARRASGAGVAELRQAAPEAKGIPVITVGRAHPYSPLPHSGIHAAPESPGPRQPTTCSIAASRCDFFETSGKIAKMGQLTALAPSLAVT
jgi:hypothetical protein